MTAMLALCALATLPAPAPTAECPELYSIGSNLRCPVCQGMPISDSPSEMARAMLRQVGELCAQGKSRQEIFDYFVARYGEWVLLEPRPQGATWLVWLLPPAVLLVGLGILFAWLRRARVGRPQPAPRDDDAYRVAVRRALAEEERR